MRPFTYLCPSTLDEALELVDLHGQDARVLAGGTDVIVRLRLGHIKPKTVIDIKRVRQLRADIDDVEGSLRFGAHAVMTDIIRDARVQRFFPALAEAARVVGSVQIRNRATLVGNICNASPAADTAPALLVYGAVLNLVGRRDRRRVPIAEFFVGPGRTTLQRGEIVESIDVPWPRVEGGSSFGRVTRRRGVDLATINLCCLTTPSGITRFAYGAVGPTPILVEDDTGTLMSQHASPETRAATLARLINHASPISDVRSDRDYRFAMLDVMSRRTLDIAVTRMRAARGA